MPTESHELLDVLHRDDEVSPVLCHNAVEIIHSEKSVCPVWNLFSRLRRVYYDSRTDTLLQAAADSMVITFTVGDNLAQVTIINMF